MYLLPPLNLESGKKVYILIEFVKIKNYSISPSKERKGSNRKYPVIGGDG